MTKNTSHNPIQKQYRNWTGNQIRGLGQFLVKTWSAFLIKGLQPSGKMRVENFRQHCGKVSVVLELSQARSVENRGEQKVSRNGASLEDFQAKQGGQKLDGNWMKMVHQRFTETSPDLEGLSLKICRHNDGKMSVIFYSSFVLSPHIAEYMRKSPIQFDISSSYLYGVVLKKLCL